MHEQFFLPRTDGVARQTAPCSVQRDLPEMLTCDPCDDCDKERSRERLSEEGSNAARDPRLKDRCQPLALAIPLSDPVFGVFAFDVSYHTIQTRPNATCNDPTYYATPFNQPPFNLRQNRPYQRGITTLRLSMLNDIYQQKKKAKNNDTQTRQRDTTITDEQLDGNTTATPQPNMQA